MALNENIVREQDERIAKLVRTPTFVVVAGALPGLFVATSAANGAYMGLATAVSILSMAIIAPATRRFTGAFSYLPVTLLAQVTVAVLVGFAIRVADPLAFEALGIYLPIASLNAMAVVFVAQDGFAAEPTGRSSIGTAAFAAICALATLAFVGFINGMFSTGQVFGLTMPELAASPLAIFGKPAGSLLVLALVAAFVQSVCDVRTASSNDVQGGGR
ncbi:MAG: Rnf-Nqr domain containing protein [Collinsella sp.]|nr:Rnf-Nqr domain containing protein [Collinsella sp.]